MAHGPEDIDWERLDKPRFFLYGAGVFGIIDAALFPMFVVKTRMQVLSQQKGAPSLGALGTAASIVRHDGLRGLYKGFGTAMLGSIPAQAMYMGTLEFSRSVAHGSSEAAGLTSTVGAGLSGATGGLLAALVTESVGVPIDVISQRLMVQGGGPGGMEVRYRNGMDVIRAVLRNEGFWGLYRGFGMSILTYLPSSAVWWGTYGVSQRVIWSQLHAHGFVGGKAEEGAEPEGERGREREGEREGEAGARVQMGVQGLGGAVAGAASTFVTTPLDVIKTRVQVAEAVGSRKPGLVSVAMSLAKEGGLRAFYKGLMPRWAGMTLSSLAWVTAYEFLKKVSAKQDEIK